MKNNWSLLSKPGRDGEIQKRMLRNPTILKMLDLHGSWTLLQNGHPPDFAFDAQLYLYTKPLQRWTGRDPIAWPTESPHFTTLDFFLWGFENTYVSPIQVHSLYNVKERMGSAIAAVSTVTPEKCVKYRFRD